MAGKPQQRKPTTSGSLENRQFPLKKTQSQFFGEMRMLMRGF